MAIFRNRDRDRRRAPRDYHDTAVAQARLTMSFHGDEQLAWTHYVERMQEFNSTPHTMAAFLRDLREKR